MNLSMLPINRLALIVGFFSFYSFGQNDLCTNAQVLTPSTACNYVSGTMNGATISSTAPSCALNASQDVWYQFVATDVTMSVGLASVIGLNHAFEIIQGGCGGNTVACTNNNGQGLSEFYQNSNFVIGSTYYIRVLNASGTATTANFNICVVNYPNQVNDLCVNAITLTPNSTCNYTSGTFSGTTITSPLASCALSASQDVWYQFVATDQTMSIGVAATIGLNHAFQILEANCGGAVLVCRNNNGVGLSESYQNSNFVVGTTYYIRVMNVNSTLTTANFEICVQSYPVALCVPTISITAVSNPACSGDNVIFNSVSTNAGLSPGYQWFVNGVSTGGNSNVIVLNSLENNDTVSCLLTSSDSCATPNLASSNPIIMSILPIPNVSIQYQNGLLVATPNLGTYSWLLGGSLLPGQVSNTTIPQVNGNYTVVVTSNEGCQSGATYNIVDLEVTENSMYSLSVIHDFETNSVTIGNPTNVTYSLSLVSGVGQALFQGKNTTVIDLSVHSPGVYFLEIDFDQVGNNGKFHPQIERIIKF